jgi:hypothetical protein
MHKKELIEESKAGRVDKSDAICMKASGNFSVFNLTLKI